MENWGVVFRAWKIEVGGGGVGFFFYNGQQIICIKGFPERRNKKMEVKCWMIKRKYNI